MIDVADPGEVFNVARYRDLASGRIAGHRAYLRRRCSRSHGVARTQVCVTDL
jgi:hypothetical protein